MYEKRKSRNLKEERSEAIDDLPQAKIRMGLENDEGPACHRLG